MTKKQLGQLTLLNAEISRDLDRLHELKSTLAGCTSSISGLPHLGLLPQFDRTGEFMSIIAEVERQIIGRILESAALYIEISAYINTIDDPLIRQIVALRYLDNLPWREVAKSVGSGISVSGVRVMLDRYLAAATRLYMVIGRLDRYYPEIRCRFACGGTHVEIPAEQICEHTDVPFSTAWLTAVHAVHHDVTIKEAA